MFNVSIPEAKSIIKTIARIHGTDLSGMSMAAFRLHLSEMLVTHELQGVENLLSRLHDDQGFYEYFIRDVFIGSPDMFRDPDFWIFFRDQLLPEIFRMHMYPEFIIPESVTGNELYTLAVLLHEIKQDHRVDLVVSCRNGMIRDRIKTGNLPYTRFKNSKDNYEVFSPGSSFENYLEAKGGKQYLKKELLQGIVYRLELPGNTLCSEKTALVLYRNRMIYQNPEMQYKTLKRIFGEMNPGTYLVTGIQEDIGGYSLESMYNTLSPEFRTYQKKDAN